VVAGNKFYIECKELKDFPKWLEKAWNQAVSHCPEWGVPVVQIHRLGANHLASDLVILPLWWFKKMMGVMKDE